MTYRELIAQYEKGIAAVNRELLKNVSSSKEFQKLSDKEFEKLEKTMQFRLFALSMELNKELKSKIKEIEELHGHDLDKEIETK